MNRSEETFSVPKEEDKWWSSGKVNFAVTRLTYGYDGVCQAQAEGAEEVEQLQFVLSNR